MMTLDDYRHKTDPKMSRKEMCRRMGVSYNTYKKHAFDADPPRLLALAAWAVLHNATV